MYRLLLSVLMAGMGVMSAAQWYDEDFDPPASGSPLIVEIDTAGPSLWQVGVPQKPLFQEAHSLPNAIVTDTVAPYPVNSLARFTVKAPLGGWGAWPVFFVRFQHAWDTDSLKDGGYVEVSWDNGTTWTNVYDDWMMPVTIENYDSNWQPVAADTLDNGQIGYSGSLGQVTTGAEWVFTSICWTNIGWMPVDTLQVRFTFESDTMPESRDGWIIDDLMAEAYIAHPVAEFMRQDDFLKVVPNPVDDRLLVIYDVDEPGTHVDLALYDLQGRLVRILRNGSMPPGTDRLVVPRNELPPGNGMLVLKARVGDRSHHQQILLLEGADTGAAGPLH